MPLRRSTLVSRAVIEAVATLGSGWAFGVVVQRRRCAVHHLLGHVDALLGSRLLFIEPREERRTKHFAGKFGLVGATVRVALLVCGLLSQLIELACEA